MIAGRADSVHLGVEADDAPIAGRTAETRRETTWFATALPITLLEGWPPRVAEGVAWGLVVTIATAEILSRFELSLISLYAVPVALAAWLATPRLAYALAAFAATFPTAFAVVGGESIGLALLSSALSNFVLLGIIAMLLTALKGRLSNDAAVLATDALTGLLNRGSFIKRLDAELARAARYGRAFTLAYVDLDNFKAVNDLEGHDAGDELLRRLADVLRSCTRQTDVIGRLGGDEFAAVLPETTGVATGSVLENLREQLMRSMTKGGWPVTFSIGAVTFEAPIDTGREALRVADAAMYSVKRSGKDGIRYVVWDGVSGPS